MTPAPSPLQRPGQERARACDGPPRGPSLTETIRARAVNVVESTIPADVTIADWRAKRRRAMTPAPCWPSRALAAVRRLMHRSEAQCHHLQDATTRYDRAARRLDFFFGLNDNR